MYELLGYLFFPEPSIVCVFKGQDVGWRCTLKEYYGTIGRFFAPAYFTDQQIRNMAAEIFGMPEARRKYVAVIKRV